MEEKIIWILGVIIVIILSIIFNNFIFGFFLGIVYLSIIYHFKNEAKKEKDPRYIYEKNLQRIEYLKEQARLKAKEDFRRR